MCKVLIIYMHYVCEKDLKSIKNNESKKNNINECESLHKQYHIVYSIAPVTTLFF